MRLTLASTLLALALAGPAQAGPPYLTDDPEPTDFGHYEIYAFSSGTVTRSDAAGAVGVDFNYGATQNLQLTAVIPIAWDAAGNSAAKVGIGNVELAAKYKFLQQDDVGFDAAIFPRVFLPAGSSVLGERHASLLLPIWVSRAWESWNVFGGGGCTINRGGGSRTFCEVGAVLARKILPDLQIGFELYHQGSDAYRSRASTTTGIGAAYDFNASYHALLSVEPGIQNSSDTNKISWYVALLTTF